MHGAQDRCVGPAFFLVYINYMYDIIKEFQPDNGGFADDHQLYLGFTPTDENLQTSIKHMKNCINNTFLLTHNLLINKNKNRVNNYWNRKTMRKNKK